MSPSAAAGCTCANACPGADHCICIYVHDSAECITECSGGGGTEVEIGGAVLRAMDTSVNVDVRDAERVQLAARLGTQVEEELYVPASTAREKLTFTQEYVTLREAIEYAGIVIGDPRDPKAD